MTRIKKGLSLLLVFAMVILSIPFSDFEALAQTDDSKEQLAIEEYQEWKESLAPENQNTGNAGARIQMTAAYSNLFGNQYIQAYVSNNGKFTIGTAEGKKLLYGHPSPWSSFSTIRINGRDYIFEADDYPLINESGTEAVSIMTLSGTTIIQRITIVNNPSTNQEDIFRIRYEITNTSSGSQAYGTRIMLDTQLGSNDGSPFVIPGIGGVTTEKEFTGNSIPQTWQSVDSLTNPSIMSVGIMYQNASERPDKVQFCSWAGIRSTNWNYSVSANRTVTGDSAVGFYFNPKECAAGQTRYVTTYYGLSGNTVIPPVKEKAIYVLPGYMGSKLYTPEGEQFWIEGTNMDASLINGDNIPLVADMAKNAVDRRSSIAMLNSDGSGSQLSVDSSKDKYGSTYIYEPIVRKLTSELGSEYTVEFFPYNWLGDLNDSTRLLEQDINRKGYEKVVFVTHSTGGLLASSYVAKSDANKKKVEKAILVAAPLFGTYASLAPLETGVGALLGEDYKLVNGFVEAVKFVESLPIPGWVKALLRVVTGVYDGANNWVKDVTHNSPTTYQLLPSAEYLKQRPAYDDGGLLDFTSKAITSTNAFYSLLNQSDNINANLTNGNNRSHKYFRQTVLGGDIVGAFNKPVYDNVNDTLLGVDTLLIYSTSAQKKTPMTATYKNKAFGGKKLSEIWYSNQGDGTVAWTSASAYVYDKGPVLRERSYKKIGHTELISDSTVMQQVCNEIKDAGGGGSRFSAVPLSMDDDSGMSEMLKLNYSCDTAVDVSILDSNQTEVARISSDDFFGFDGGDFIFTSYADEANVTDATIYMPNQGYKIIFSYGDADSVSVDFKCEASTLVADGWKDVGVNHAAIATSADGTILTLDGTIQAILSDNISSEITGNVVIHYTDWELQDDIKMNLDDIQNMNVIGNHAAQVEPLLNWDSSDENIVEVSESGVLVAKGYGIATISATDGNKSSVCQVTVMQNATDVELFDVDMTIGERVLINPQFTPLTTTEVDMIYSLSESGIIDIDDNGVIQALSAGTVTVTGETIYGIQDQFTVTVDDIDDYSAVANDKSALTWATIENGNTAQSAVTVDLTLPTIGASGSTISWVSSDENVISGTGICNRPAFFNGDKHVTLTAFISKGSVSDIVTFNLTVPRKVIEAGQITPIRLDTDTTATIQNYGDMKLFSYTPSKSTTIRFTSYGSSDTYGYVYNHDFKELARNDDGGSGSNFLIQYSLQAGRTYYFAARYYRTSQTGNFTVRLETISKQSQRTPAAPTLKSKSKNSVTLNAVPNAEYQRDGGAWQSSATFTGLKVNTRYRFAVRLKETSTHQVSPTSGLLIVTTNKIRLSKPQKLKLAKRKASWKKVANNNGYTLKVMQGKKTVFKVQIKKNKTSYKFTKAQLKKLKKGKKYTFTLVAKGKGNYSKSKTAKSKAVIMKK